MEQVVRDAVGDAFPDAEPTSFTETRTGNNKHTVVVTLRDRRQLVVQYRATAYGDLDPDGHVTRLVDERTDVPVPDVLAFGAVNEYAYLITRLVDGTNLHQHFETLPDDDRTAIVETLGAHLGTIHETFTFDAYGAIAAANDHLHVPDGTTGWRDWVARYLQAGLAAFEEPLTDLVDPIAAAVTGELDALPQTPTARFYPWDYRPGNVLITAQDDPEIAAVLDWGDPLAGHRELSMAKSEYLIADWYADPDLADDLRDAFYRGYRTTSSVPAPYFDQRRRLYRLVGIVRSAYDSSGQITLPRYPMLDEAGAATFHRTHLEALL